MQRRVQLVTHSFDEVGGGPVDHQTLVGRVSAGCDIDCCLHLVIDSSSPKVGRREHYSLSAVKLINSHAHPGRQNLVKDFAENSGCASSGEVISAT